eukprot:gb/GEZN01018442.1/.p1 GENE.gb/GEZN01018442.1/~~gb/GEZN01018442.1/.p1  ORF type:complete len:149 (+),score=14.60 gb/GEZN01018442.1/:233-679(+)
MLRRTTRLLAGHKPTRDELFRWCRTPQPGDLPYRFFDMAPPFAGDFLKYGGLNNIYWRAFRTRPHFGVFALSYILFSAGAAKVYLSYYKPTPKVYVPPRDKTLSFLPDIKGLPDFMTDSEKMAQLSFILDDPLTAIPRTLDYYAGEDE